MSEPSAAATRLQAMGMTCAFAGSLPATRLYSDRPGFHNAHMQSLRMSKGDTMFVGSQSTPPLRSKNPPPLDLRLSLRSLTTPLDRQSFQTISDQLRVFRSPQAATTAASCPHTVPNPAQPSRPTFCQPWLRDVSVSCFAAT